MLNQTIRWRGRWPLPVSEIWFARAGDTVALRCSLLPRPLRLLHAERRIDGVSGRWEAWKTLLTDLATVDALEAKLGRSTRYQIRRAFDRDGLRVIDDWSPDALAAFADAHDPQNPNRPDLALMQRLAAQGRLGITAAVADDEPLCAHAYVDDGRRVRLLHSYSRRPRPGDGAGDSADAAEALKEFGARIGRANKALHWRDLERFRDRGLEVYDWGGFSGREGDGIDRFKLLFLGEPREEWVFKGWIAPRLGALRF